MASSQTQKNDECLTPTEGDLNPQEHPDVTNGDEIKEESAPKTLEFAAELFDKGLKAIQEEDYVEAVDCLSRSLEIRVEKHGELAPECATSYYKYGCALLYKAREESDPLGNVPKILPTKSEKHRSSNNLGVGEGSKAFATDAEESTARNEKEANDKEQKKDSEGSDADTDGEELEADEEDSDLDLAWKMLDVARAILEKNPEDIMEKVDVYSALAEVSMEREDFETSLNDYLKALSTCERLEAPESRRIIELNFMICLVFEVWGKVEESITYCEKAISLCKSRLKLVSENVNQTALPDNPVDGNEASNNVELCAEEKDKEFLGGILVDLEKKLEDLQQALSNPKPVLADIMKMIAAKASSNNTELGSGSSNSSKIDATNIDSSFDSSTNNSGGTVVTHLGVVGRGVKRANLSPTAPEPSAKRLSVDPSSDDKDGGGGSVSQSADSTAVQDAEALN